jgi:hypothetical protein
LWQPKSEAMLTSDTGSPTASNRRFVERHDVFLYNLVDYSNPNSHARIAQSVEREAFNLKAEGSSPSSGGVFYHVQSFLYMYLKCADRFNLPDLFTRQDTREYVDR